MHLFLLSTVVSFLILTSVFLLSFFAFSFFAFSLPSQLRRSELQFFYQEGTNWIFPDAYERYASVIPKAERGDLITAFHRRLTGKDEAEKLKCAIAWSCYEMATSRLYVDPAYIAQAEEDGPFAIAFARIETHYFVNGYVEDHRTHTHIQRAQG